MKDHNLVIVFCTALAPTLASLATLIRAIRTGKAVEKTGKKVEQVQASVNGNLLRLLASKRTGDEMFETYLIQFAISIITDVVKNPAYLATFKSQLLDIANGIYGALGMTPPALPAAKGVKS